MNGLKGWKLASVHGVDIRLHVSLIFLLTYVILIAGLNFPGVLRESGINPQAVSGTPALWAVAFAVALFFSVLLHELGHVLVAQRLGVQVRSITLMMLGGVSEMGPIPERPYAEFKIAIVGPLVSIALGGLLLFLKSHTQSADLALFSYWLGRVNLGLGIFNLMPAFPLDGGRVFRSLAAPRLGMLHATQRAVRVSRGLAVFFGVLGALSFNLLLIAIALFVYAASQAELVLLVGRRLVQGLRAGDVGVRHPPIPAEARLSEVARAMAHARMTELPVRMGVGRGTLISMSQLRSVARPSWDWVQARQVVLPATRVLDVADDLKDAFVDLASQGALPLFEHGEPVGVVRYRDLQDILEIRSLSGSYPVDEEHPGTEPQDEEEQRRAS